MNYQNNIFNDLQKYILENKGSDGFFNTSLGNDYLKEMEEIKKFHGKRVTINFTYKADFITEKNCKTGRILVEDGRIKFFEGNKRSKFYNLDAGLFNGFYATLIPLKIQELNQSN